MQSMHTLYEESRMKYAGMRENDCAARLNTMRWPNAPVADGGALGFSRGGAPFSFLNSPAVLEHAWGASIDGLVGALPAGSNATEDVLWTIGLRGMNDYAWWVDSQGDERASNLTLRWLCHLDALIVFQSCFPTQNMIRGV